MKSQRQKKLLFMRKDWGEIIDVHITDFVWTMGNLWTCREDGRTFSFKEMSWQRHTEWQ
jgi:hypothetical protein